MPSDRGCVTVWVEKKCTHSGATVTLIARFCPWQARIPDRLHPVPVLTSAASYDSAAAAKKGSSVDPCVSILLLIGVQTCIQKCGKKDFLLVFFGFVRMTGGFTAGQLMRCKNNFTHPIFCGMQVTAAVTVMVLKKGQSGLKRSNAFYVCCFILV